ncbi:MAG: M48 family metallopeptidase [Parvularcula sp.]|jgi:predicted Zn-dependent protease|nr:M48 family metallopeptidase [Parvularcula sp.]
MISRAWSRKGAIAALALTLGVAGCTYNEQLGRNQLLLGSEESIAAAADQAWAQIKQQERVSQDPRYTTKLNRVAPKLITAMGGNPAEWDYQVFASDDLNAFALPGKKIGVYTGIMDITENDAQLAAIVGHEIAHVEFNHARERSAQNTLGQVGALGVGLALGTQCQEGDRACQDRSLQMAALGVSVFGILPYSRTHELEADVGGLRLMRQAGYDVCEAVEFWRNMQQASANQARPPEFLSTHPGGDTRIQTLQQEARRLGANC